MVAWGLINPSVPPDQMIGTFLAMSFMVSPDFSAISSSKHWVASARV